MPPTYLARVCAALHGEGVRFAIAGGYAVALHGAVRGTVDVDFVVEWSLESLRRSERALGGLGLVSRQPIEAEDLFRFREEYVAKRNLLAWNFYNPANQGEQVDLLVTFDLAGRRRRMIETADGAVPVLNRKDLIAMKRASDRPQDREDVEALERLR